MKFLPHRRIAGLYKIILLSFKTAENAAEYDELVTLLRQAEVIRKNAAIVEKKLEQYAEYLQFDE